MGNWVNLNSKIKNGMQICLTNADFYDFSGINQANQVNLRHLRSISELRLD